MNNEIKTLIAYAAVFTLAIVAMAWGIIIPLALFAPELALLGK